MTVNQAIEEYLRWKKMIYPCAAKSYTSYLRTFVSNFQGSNLEDMNMDTILGYIETRKAIYKPKSVYFLVSILKDFFKYYPNIINPHHIKYPRLGVPEIRYLSKGEFELIDESLSETNYYDVRLKLVHHLLWSTGLRVGELCTILLNNIDLKKRSAKIITLKSKKMGYIMWSEKANKLLIDYLGFRLMRGGEYLFDVSPRTIQRMICSAAENAGLEGITPHKYRHGKAHQVLKDGGSIDDVAFILRHASHVMTKTMYLRLDQEENLSIMQKYI